MAIVVTGAGGKLGSLVVEALLARGVPAAEIVATARDAARLTAFADRGVVTRSADFGDPDSLAAAFAGVDRFLLVSTDRLGERLALHRAAIDAATAAGASLIAYTSIPHADTTTMLLAREHRQTEELLEAGSVPAVLLRNSWYHENYTDRIATLLARGVVGAARDGRVSAATRADYAGAAAAVLTAPDQGAATYELGGPAFTLAELAAVVTEESGTPVAYTDVPVGQLQEILAGAGVPAPMAEVLADSDRGIAGGELEVPVDDLRALLGREPTPLRDTVRAALAR